MPATAAELAKQALRLTPVDDTESARRRLTARLRHTSLGAESSPVRGLRVAVLLTPFIGHLVRE